VREIDPHVEVLECFGAHCSAVTTALIIRCDAPLRATQQWLAYASVTTTENFVLCAALARGTSTLTTPHVSRTCKSFCRFMQMLGVRIEGAGTSRLVIEGPKT